MAKDEIGNIEYNQRAPLDPNRINISVNCPDPKDDPAAVAMVRLALYQSGIESDAMMVGRVNLEEVKASSTILERILTQKLAVSVSDHRISGPDADQLSPQFITLDDLSNNIWGPLHESGSFDVAIEQLAKTSDPDEVRKILARAIAEVMYDSVCYVANASRGRLEIDDRVPTKETKLN